jgi:hypothetical protein
MAPQFKLESFETPFRFSFADPDAKPALPRRSRPAMESARMRQAVPPQAPPFAFATGYPTPRLLDTMPKTTPLRHPALPAGPVRAAAAAPARDCFLVLHPGNGT